MTPSRILALLGVTALLVLGVVIVASGFSGSDRRVRAVFDSAVQLAPGQEVRMAGRKVGEVGSIETFDGRAIVELNIKDEDVWPLRRGTTSNTRWGSTTSLAYRYVELHSGPAGAPSLPENAVLPPARTRTAFELDQAFRIFRGRTREDLKRVVGQLGDTLEDQGPSLARGLRSAPGGLDNTSDVLRELGADQEALRTLVVSGDRATTALAVNRRDLGQLISHAAATFDELAEHARAQQAALERAPRAFDTSTGTLRRLDTSLVVLDGLLDDLAPGARELRTLAAPARRALVELRDIVPTAASALRSGRRAAPPLVDLLKTGTSFLPRLGNVLAQVAPVMACLRPYAPELAGNMATWTGWNKNFDNGGHYGRTFDLMANPLLLPGTSLNSLQVTTALKDRVRYAMPRPPGLNAGQPWFQPQCGAGPEALDATKDPEGAGR